jgi:hypothetical protein
MSLQSWLANRWLVEHDSSAEEIADLRSVVDRDLIDAKVAGVSCDWRLAMAYLPSPGVALPDGFRQKLFQRYSVAAHKK